MAETYTIRQLCEVLTVSRPKMYKLVSFFREFFPGLERGPCNSLRFTTEAMEFASKVLALQNSGMTLEEIHSSFSKPIQNRLLNQNPASLESSVPVQVSGAQTGLQTIHQENVLLRDQVKGLEGKIDIINEQNRILYNNFQEMKRGMDNQMSLCRNLIRRSIELMAEKEPVVKIEAPKQPVKSEKNRLQPKQTWGGLKRLWVNLFQPELLREV